MRGALASALAILVWGLLIVATGTMAEVARAEGVTTDIAATGTAADGATAKSMLSGREAAPAGRGWFADLQSWLQRQQQSLNRGLSGSVRQLKTEGSAMAGLVLIGLSFLYGILHAAGPGHGKAIISSYAVATTQTIRRSLWLALLAALFQALSAISLVLLLALAFKATGLEIQAFSRRLEQASFALITVFGLWLMIAALRRYVFARPRASAHAHEHHHAPGHAHEHGPHCGHAHGPEPKDLAGPLSWRRAILLAATVGLRPCSGAILLLIFALTQGMLWAGILGTLAMSLGTALTVGILAAIAVGTREIAERSSSERIGRVIEAVAAIGGATLVLGLGAVLFLASLGPAPPF